MSSRNMSWVQYGTKMRLYVLYSGFAASSPESELNPATVWGQSASSDVNSGALHDKGSREHHARAHTARGGGSMGA